MSFFIGYEGWPESCRTKCFCRNCFMFLIYKLNSLSSVTHPKRTHKHTTQMLREMGHAMKQTSAENHRRFHCVYVCVFFYYDPKRSCGWVGQHPIKDISTKMGSQAKETLEATCLSFVSFISACFAWGTNIGSSLKRLRERGPQGTNTMLQEGRCWEEPFSVDPFGICRAPLCKFTSVLADLISWQPALRQSWSILENVKAFKSKNQKFKKPGNKNLCFDITYNHPIDVFNFVF